MSMKFFDVTLRREGGAERTLRVPSPTGVQAGDAAAPLLLPGESILSIREVEDDGLQQADALPPRTQTEELTTPRPGARTPDRSI